MVNIERLTVNWTGFVGAPGISTFYFLDAVAAVDDVYSLFNAAGSFLPVAVRWDVQKTGITIDPLTGDAVGTWGGAAPAGDEGADSSGYAAPAGFCMNWLTGSYVRGRRLKGRTYFVPAANALFQTDGSIVNSSLATLQAAATALVTDQAANFIVWSRPTLEDAGAYAIATTAIVPDKAVILRSRRD